MSELKACPFCGNEMSEDNFFSCDGYPKACGCWEKTHSAKEAMDVWNTRPLEDALQTELKLAAIVSAGKTERIEALQAELERQERMYERLWDLVDKKDDELAELDDLKFNIRKAIAEIEKLQTAYINEGDTYEYEVIGGALDILAQLKGEE